MVEKLPFACTFKGSTLPRVKTFQLCDASLAGFLGGRDKLVYVAGKRSCAITAGKRAVTDTAEIMVCSVCCRASQPEGGAPCQGGRLPFTRIPPALPIQVPRCIAGSSDADLDKASV